MDYPSIEFDEKKVTSTTCYLNEEMLAEVNSASDTSKYLPKVERTYGKLSFPNGNEYPYSFASIALSVDGKMAYPERPEGPLVAISNRLNPDGALTDFYVLNFLRAYSDLIIQGSNTLKAEEDLWNVVFDKDLVEERVKYLGKKTEHPGTVIITLDGTDIPLDHQLFSQNKLPLCIFTTTRGAKYLEENGNGKFKHVLSLVDGDSGKKLSEIINTVSEVISVISADSGSATDLKLFMKSLKVAGVNQVIVESPTITWLMMKEKIMNEYFLTYTTTFIGGQLSPGWNMPFSFEDHPHAEILQLNNHKSSFIYTRQVLRYDK
ncbi:MAG: pyrimidine reductase riboflavin biosynthesi [Fusobacteria bacterium]|nr:MAG: pyrimidine reductase riboflavin biosynthesi [Fusobacteriota bacterium]KAF0227904.1 MAG: pyrimidine reductase riboflavin [Fusobacteriota bacterium]